MLRRVAVATARVGRTRFTRGARRRSILLAALAALTVLLCACGSSSSSSGSSSTSSSSSGSSQAASILTAATKGFVTSASLSTPLQPLTQWNGPSSASPSLHGAQMIGVAACQDPCAYVGSLVGGLGQRYGANSYTGSVGAAPPNWQSLTEQAIQRHAKVILFNGVADAAVSQQVADARKAGVKTVGVAVEQTVAAGQGYDAYVSVRQDVSYRLMIQAAIASSGGKAQIALFEPAGYPSTDRYVAQAVADLHADCAACSIQVVKQAIPTLADPVQMDQLVTATLNGNPKLNYLLFGDDFYQIGAAKQAASRLGRNVTLIAQDGSTAGLQLVANGTLLYDAGVPLEWIAYAGNDAIRRVVNGQPPLPPNGWGGGAHLWTKSNLPSSLTNQAASQLLAGYIDYRSAYVKLWSGK